MCALFLVSVDAKSGHSIPETGVSDGCELQCGCWGLNLGPLQEQLLSTDPSLQSPVPASFHMVGHMSECVDFTHCAGKAL